jgi:transcriptional regulator with XRE-family HTH domain
MSAPGKPADSTTAFGALLRRHRVAAGLTQEALAERAGLSVFGVQKLERGATHPYRDSAERLIAALELPAAAADQLREAAGHVRRRGSLPRDDRRSNLPVALTSFVGRERELESIAARLQTVRLLTLTGLGGAGKTRLAIEVGRCVAERYRDGVRLVELAAVTDPGLVAHRVAAVLHLPERVYQELAVEIADALRTAHMLVILDNCEHVLDACAPLVDVLLRECPALHILATSREPIGISGEVTWSVPTLTTPSTDPTASIAEIARSPAVRLLVERASVTDPSLRLDTENAHALA